MVLRGKVEQFLSTLKGYSESCADSKKAVFKFSKEESEKAESCESERIRCVSERKPVVSAVTQMRDECNQGNAVLAAVNDFRKKTKDQSISFRKNVQSVDRSFKAAEEFCCGCKIILARVDGKE